MSALFKMAIVAVGFVLTVVPLTITVLTINKTLGVLFSVGASILLIDWFTDQIYLADRLNKLEERK